VVDDQHTSANRIGWTARIACAAPVRAHVRVCACVGTGGPMGAGARASIGVTPVRYLSKIWPEVMLGRYSREANCRDQLCTLGLPLA
jgi:hypothetical protein